MYVWICIYRLQQSLVIMDFWQTEVWSMLGVWFLITGLADWWIAVSSYPSVTSPSTWSIYWFAPLVLVSAIQRLSWCIQRFSTTTIDYNEYLRSVRSTGKAHFAPHLLLRHRPTAKALTAMLPYSLSSIKTNNVAPQCCSLQRRESL